MLLQGVVDVLCEACERLKWKEPSKIQKEAIPVSLTGNVSASLLISLFMWLLNHTISCHHHSHGSGEDVVRQTSCSATDGFALKHNVSALLSNFTAST